MNESKATRYQRLRRRAEGASSVAGAVCLAAIALSPASRRLADFARTFGRSLPAPMHAGVAIVVFVAMVVVLWEIVALPAVMYSGLAIDRRFRKTDHSVRGMLMAQVHATLVALPAAWITALVVVVTVRLFGAWWWALAGLLLAGLLVSAAQIAPSLFARVGRARPLTRRDLAERLADLAKRTGVGVAGIEQWDVAETARATAFVAGMGRTRRIFLSSETLRDWTDDEIAVVVAHELAHHAHHDLWRTLALDALVLVVGLSIADRVVSVGATTLRIAGPGDVAALPILALVAGAVWVAFTPLRHAQSRAHERRADRFALALTGADDAFGAAIRRLGTHYLAEERPSLVTRWLYHRHPSVDERLALAASFRERRVRGSGLGARSS